jgi:hypothetical protein
MPPAKHQPRTVATALAGGLLLFYFVLWSSPYLGKLLGFPLQQYVAGGTVLVMLVAIISWLGWISLRDSGPTRAEFDQVPRKQFSLFDLFILTSILALEIGAIAQNNIVLSCLFISASISVLALVWNRLWLRRSLIISMVAVGIIGLIAQESRKW